jgi:DNA-binding SARP family transcriptional activator
MPEQPRLALLGGFGLTDPTGQACPIASSKARALLAILALAPDQTATHDTLLGLLWSDRGDAQARDSLKHALADLKARLAAAGIHGLDIQRHGIRLDPAFIETDVSAFQTAARQDGPSVERALNLYTGDLLEGTSVRDSAFEDWLGFERRRLRDLAESTAARLIEIGLAKDDLDLAFAAAQRLAQFDPLREDAARAIMRHHAMTGERAAALRSTIPLSAGLQPSFRPRPTKPQVILRARFATGRHCPKAVLDPALPH